VDSEREWWSVGVKDVPKCLAMNLGRGDSIVEGHGKKIMPLPRCRIIFGCSSSDGLTRVQI
jgi:hypothetical protein